jgi:Rad3-related DNA helicase
VNTKKRERIMSQILEYFPGTPRQAQTEALTQFEKVYRDSDVIVLSCPTGAGKSFISYTIARWHSSQNKKKTAILTPTKLLVDQYLSLFPKLTTIKNMKDYICHTYDGQEQQVSCKRSKELSDTDSYCNNCKYTKAIRTAHAMPFGVFNNWIYMAHRLFRDQLILDEGHLILDMIREFSGKKLWQKDYGFPGYVRTYQQLLKWIEGQNWKKDAKLSLLHSELTSGQIRYLVQRTTEDYRGEEQELIKLLPVDVRDQPPILWPPAKVKKLVFMSATIGPKDMEAMGLDKRRVSYIEVESPIPVERRPVFYSPKGNMSYAAQASNIPILLEYIRELLQNRKEAGLIHAPYSLASELAKGLRQDPRILFHTQENKKEVYERFRKEGPAKGLVLLASGLYEGISLDNEAGRWQVITKVPYPSLGEPGYQWMAENDPKQYAWQAIRLVVQAAGRICRGPEDFGETFITDTSFGRLYSQNEELFPRYFKEALIDN